MIEVLPWYFAMCKRIKSKVYQKIYLAKEKMRYFPSIVLLLKSLTGFPEIQFGLFVSQAQFSNYKAQEKFKGCSNDSN